MLEPFKFLFASYLTILLNFLFFIFVIILNTIILKVIFKANIFKIFILNFINQGFFICVGSGLFSISINEIIPLGISNKFIDKLLVFFIILITLTIVIIISHLFLKCLSKVQLLLLLLIFLINILVIYIFSDKYFIFMYWLL